MLAKLHLYTEGPILNFNPTLTSKRGTAFVLALVVASATTGGGALAASPTNANRTVTPQRASRWQSQKPTARTVNSQKTNADDVLREIPRLLEATKSNENMDRVLQLEQEGEKYFQKHELDKALIKWQEAYGISIELKFADGEGRALTNMCRIFLDRGQFTKAKQLGENAIEVLFGTANKKDLGRARVALAQAYFGLDNPDWAGEQLQLALETFNEIGADDAPEAARVMMLAAGILLKGGRFKECIQFYQGAASYYGQAGNKFQELGTRISVASMMMELGWLVAALEEANKALAGARDLKDPDLLASALAMVGGCQYNLAEYASASKSFEEALQVGSQVKTELSRANLEANYGEALAAVGDRDQAKARLERALPILTAKATPHVQSRVLNTLGNLEVLQGNYGRGIQLLNQTLDMQAIANPKSDGFTVLIMHNLAAAESRSGDNRTAKMHLASSLQLFKKYKSPLMEGRTYSSLAEVTWNLKDVAQAEAYVKQGIAVSEKINDDAALWRDYTLLARIQLSQGLQVPARESLTSALSYFRSPQAGPFNSAELLGFPATREDLGQQLVSLLVQQDMVEPALLAAEQLKEETFINEWHRRGGEVKPYERDIYNDLVLQRAHLHAAENTTTPDKLVKEWQSWYTRFQLTATDNRMLARLIAPVPMTTEDILREVQRNQATMIDYLVGAHSTVVFTVDLSRRIQADVLPAGRAELQPQVASLLASSSRTEALGGQSDRRTLQILYSELFPEKVRNVLPTNADETVVIIPDGVLFNLPFAALIDGAGKYLVESHTLTMAASMGVFLDSPPRYSQDLSVVVASNDGLSERGKDETTMISNVFEPELVTRLVGKDAEIQTLQEQAKGKAVVHIGSSLPLQASNPLRSVLPISSKDSEKVTAGRLFEISLPNDLVVWSATSVSAKDLQGNGVKVFSRGLSYAGVRNVLMSLWIEPGPQRTEELIEFYKSNRNGLSQAQALRKAQLVAMSRDPSPRSWAGLQLLGPGR